MTALAQGDTIKAGDFVTHVRETWDPPLQVLCVDAELFPDDPIAFFATGGFWRTSQLRKVEPR